MISTRFSPHTSSENRITAPNFITTEFARLIDVIIDGGAEIRRGLLASGLSLTRSELDSGILRDEV